LVCGEFLGMGEQHGPQQDESLELVRHVQYRVLQVLSDSYKWMPNLISRRTGSRSIPPPSMLPTSW
jgi:hypothetical protein